MLFHSSVRKELSRTFGASLVVLITVVMTMMLIRVLFLANRGRVNPTDVLLIMGYFVLGHLPTILTLCLFIAIVVALSRMHSDSEMVIWNASGRGLTGFISPLVGFAWPICVAIAVLALFVWPWSNEQAQNMRTKFEQRSDLDRITPGTFQESANGSRVFFIDKEDEKQSDTKNSKSATGKENAKKNKDGLKLDGNDKLSKEVEKFANSRSNIFISTVSNGKESVTTASAGRIESRDGSQYLLLNNGQRSEIDSKTGQIKVSEFEEYGNLIKSAKLTPFEGGPSKAMSSYALLANRTNGNMGELAWRLGLAFAAVNFIILGAAIANGNPRAGRGASFVFALMAFMFYYNLINLSQSWIASGQFRFTALILAMHGGIFIVSALWLAKRHNNWSFLAALKHRKTSKASTLKAAT
ncbi:MAG: LPS export ABC transporter permease LptF [Burkholderiaceae bacterium]